MALFLRDRTSNANNLTNNGAAEITGDAPFAGGGGTVASLVAAESDYLATPDSTSLSITGDITIELWIKRASTGSFMTMVGKWSQAAGQKSYRVAFLADNTIRFNTTDDGTNDAINTNSTGTVTNTSDWVHIAVAFNATTRVTRFYINASLDTTSGAGSTGAIFDGTNELAIGRSGDGTGTQFDGRMQDIRVWNTVRSGAQISASYQARLIGTESGLQAYYNFDETAGGAALFGLM